MIANCKISNAPVLVLLHGWGMQSTIFQGFAQELAKFFQVISLDLPGHGQNAQVVPENLEQLAALMLTNIATKQFYILGWSFGASVAISMAYQQPERVLALFTIAANPKFVQAEHWPGVSEPDFTALCLLFRQDPAYCLQRFLMLQVHGLRDAKPLLKQLKLGLTSFSQANQHDLAQSLQLLKTSDLCVELAQLSMPCHFIYGEQDRLVPIACLQAVQQLNPNIKCSSIKQAGHAAFISHPQAVLTNMFSS